MIRFERASFAYRPGAAAGEAGEAAAGVADAAAALLEVMGSP